VDNLILSLKKRFFIPAVLLLALLIWLLLSQAFYRSYWEGTLERVQTVDFNLLHHTLPTTLSELIIADRDDLVQKVLDANYGLFGLVITDPSGSSIIYSTNRISGEKAWQKYLSPEGLASLKEPADWLCDPPPLEPQWQHLGPRLPEATKASEKPAGNVIGKLYYLRSEPPTFIEDFTSFLAGGLLDRSGSARGYLFAFLISMSFSMVIVLLIWLRRRGLRLKQQELEHISQELEIRKKGWQHVNTELLAQKSQKFWLEKEAELSHRRAVNLRHVLEKLRDTMAGREQLTQPANGSYINLDLAANQASDILKEIEVMIPDLTRSAAKLKAQATVLNEYCHILEQKQSEISPSVAPPQHKSDLQPSADLLDMSPG
jgi:hypothetical protein